MDRRDGGPVYHVIVPVVAVDEDDAREHVATDLHVDPAQLTVRPVLTCDTEGCEKPLDPTVKAEPVNKDVTRGFRCLYCLSLFCADHAHHHFGRHNSRPACNFRLNIYRDAWKDIREERDTARETARRLYALMLDRLGDVVDVEDATWLQVGD